MLGGIGTSELLVILVIVLVIFGAGKLPEVGGALGKGIRNFKRASKGQEDVDVTPTTGASRDALQEPKTQRPESTPQASAPVGAGKKADA